MANFRYNINDQRWSNGDCYSVIDYSVSYDPIKNESTVTFGRTLTRVWGAEGTTSYSTTTLTVRANDGGATASTTASASDYFWNYGFIVLQPYPSQTSVTVKHSAVAGTKNVTISASTVLSYNGNESSSASGFVTVPTGEYFPASSLIISDGTLGVSQTLEVDRIVDSFTHTITYACGDASGTICTKSSSTRIAWTPPISLASQNVHGTSVAVQFTITTYSGDTVLDTKTASITCAIPESVKPSFTVAVSDAMGYSKTFGGYVQTKSKLKIVVDITTMYDATVSSVKVIANGETHNESDITTEALKDSGTNTITVEVTDSRGRKVSGNTTVAVLAYSAPAISLFTYNRCDSDGTDNPLGDNAEITFSSAVTSLNSKNSISYKMEYKKTSAATYATVNMSDFARRYSVTNGTRIFAADAGSSYDVRLTVTDSFGSAVASLVVDTGSAIMHWLPRGVGMAIGKIAEKLNTLELGWKIHMNGNKIEGLGNPVEDQDAVPLNVAKKLQARNLLDNSDFRNPVNQRGQESYNLPSWGGYTIDRWAVTADGATVTLTPNGLKLTGYLYQPIPEFDDRLAGKTLTLAAKVNGEILCCSGVVTYTGEWHRISEIGSEALQAFIAINAVAEHESTLLWAEIGAMDATFEWIALYEGEYTAETLPEYQPKGYGVEMAECRRYFQKYKTLRLIPFVYEGTSTRHYHIAFDTPMRVKYPTYDMSGLVERANWSTTGGVFNIYELENNFATLAVSGEVSARENVYVEGTLTLSADL